MAKKSKKSNIGCMGFILGLSILSIAIYIVLILLVVAVAGGIIYGMIKLYQKGKFDSITEKINVFIKNTYSKIFKKDLDKLIITPKYFTILSTVLILIAYGSLLTNITRTDNDAIHQDNIASIEKVQVENKQDSSIDKEYDSNEELTTNSENDKVSSDENVKEESTETSHITTTETASNNKEDIFPGYKLIEVYGGDLSGHREPNVVVDIGFGDRKYWAFTNQWGQLVKVIADEIILQDDSKEPVTSNGRYYSDEAKVPGVESKNLDEGHVIADSLGGVSNAYNITPQNSTLNRHGDQAYMEKAIRDAGGCTNFVAIITYPDTKTQIPSHYSYTYTIKGNVVKDEFDNVNPDEYNSSLNSNMSSNNSSVNNTLKDESQVNTNSSGIVYWAPNGKSYHTTKNCSTLSRSKTILEGTISTSGKHDPCDRCH